MKRPYLLTLCLALIIASSAVLAQRPRFFSGGGNSNDPRSEQDPGAITPMWNNAPGFEKDVFTFVRIMYSGGGSGRGWRRGGRWRTDYPDADVNLAYRLQQMTSIKVDPFGKRLGISDPELFRYPFIYIVEPGSLQFTEDEVPILRRYLMNGGFLMCDDFWGDDEWENLETELRRVFPDRPIVDLPRTHPVFHCVFDLPNDLNLQIPNVEVGTNSQYTGRTWERGEDTMEAHIRGIYDKDGPNAHLCVVICHNTDNGDGWEWEGNNQYYFREFSEKKAYPLTINIIYYAMTH